MNAIPASIEIAPKQGIESEALPGLFPPGTWVYITDVGTDSNEALASAAKRVRELSYEPVPHFASRRLPSVDALAERIAMMRDLAGVTNVLVIGGGLGKPAGPFTATMDVLETGLFDKYGITHMGIAGHPEGSPDFSDEIAEEMLRAKQAFGERTGLKLRVVTQFGFDADKFVNWAAGVKNSGINLPVHLGVAGPAKITTLIKYAAMCGVGASMAYLKRNAFSITKLATSHSPDEIVSPMEARWQNEQAGAVSQIHVFPFGGIKKSAEWLYERGTWQKNEDR